MRHFFLDLAIIVALAITIIVSFCLAVGFAYFYFGIWGLWAAVLLWTLGTLYPFSSLYKRDEEE